MVESNFHIEVESHDSATVVIPIGDVDLSRSSDLRLALKPLINASTKKIIVDLASVSYMDSSGVATLIEALQLSKRADINFMLCCLTDGVRSIIELARLDQIFAIYATREDSLES